MGHNINSSSQFFRIKSRIRTMWLGLKLRGLMERSQLAFNEVINFTLP
jgi:hypothetical protein